MEDKKLAEDLGKLEIRQKQAKEILERKAVSSLLYSSYICEITSKCQSIPSQFYQDLRCLIH